MKIKLKQKVKAKCDIIDDVTEFSPEYCWAKKGDILIVEEINSDSSPFNLSVSNPVNGVITFGINFAEIEVPYALTMFKSGMKNGMK